MDDIIEIAGFDLDGGKIEKSLEDISKKLVEVSRSQKTLRDENKALQDEYKSLIEQQDKAAKESGKESEAYKKLTEQIKTNTAAQAKVISNTKQEQQASAELSKEYKNTLALKKAIEASAQGQANAQEVLNEVLETEITNVRLAELANSKLTEAKKKLNVTTVEGAKLNAEINKRIDENTKFMKENGSATEKQRLNIGNYKADIMEAYEALKQQKEALNEQKGALTEAMKETEKGSEAWNAYYQQLNQVNIQINVVANSMGEASNEVNGLSAGSSLLSGNLLDLAKQSEQAGGAQQLLAGGIKQSSKAVLDLTKSFMAFLLTPIGVVIMALVLAFTLIKNAMDKNAETADKVVKAFSVLGSVFEVFFRILEPLGTFLVDTLVSAFEMATEAVSDMVDILVAGLALLGFDKAAESVNNYANEVREAAKDARDLADAQVALVESERNLKVAISENAKEISQLKAIRDDDTRSIKDRVKANAELGAILSKQLEQERANAEEALRIVRLKLKTQKDNVALLDEEADARVKLNNIETAITEKQREQITSRNNLARAGAEKQAKIVDASLQKQKEQLDLWVSQQGVRAKTFTEQLAIEEGYYTRSLNVLKNSLKHKKISQEAYDKEVLLAQQKLAGARANVVINAAKRELDLEILSNKSKIESGKMLTDEMLTEELNRERSLTDLRIKLEEERRAQGVTNEEQYQDEILKIKDAYNQKEKDLNKQFREDEKASRLESALLEAEEEIIRLEEKNATDYEVKQARLESEYEADKVALEARKIDGQITEENYLKATDNLNRQYALNAINIKREEENAKLGLAGNAATQLSQLAGESSKAGKAFALASALINTYQGITAGIALGFPLSIPAVAMASLTGFAAVKNITATKTPTAPTTKTTGETKAPPTKFAKGGTFKAGGRPHSQGGTGFFGEDGSRFEAQAGEVIGVLSNKASGAFMDFNKFFSDYDPSRNSSVQNNASGGNGNADLVNAISEAVKAGAEAGASQGSQRGIRDLTTDRDIMNNKATF